MGYLAGALAIAYIVFGWSFNIGLVPVGWILIGGLLLADFLVES